MADTKVSDLTLISAVAFEDLLYVVDDPGGTPASRKATVQDLYNGLMGYTPPVSGDFSWVNQGDATLSTARGWMAISEAVDAGLNLRLRVKAAPATPYTITTASLLNLGEPGVGGESEPSMGLCYRQSSDGKLVTCGIQGTNTINLATGKWNSATSFSAGYSVSPIGMFLPTSVFWSRIADDGSDRTWSVSADGVHWTTLHTVGRTDFLTADEVGIFIRASTTRLVANTLLSWVEA
jgi:hypothetical protein